MKDLSFTWPDDFFLQLLRSGFSGDNTLTAFSDITLELLSWSIPIGYALLAFMGALNFFRQGIRSIYFGDAQSLFHSLIIVLFLSWILHLYIPIFGYHVPNIFRSFYFAVEHLYDGIGLPAEESVNSRDMLHTSKESMYSALSQLSSGMGGEDGPTGLAGVVTWAYSIILWFFAFLALISVGLGVVVSFAIAYFMALLTASFLIALGPIPLGMAIHPDYSGYAKNWFMELIRTLCFFPIARMLLMIVYVLLLHVCNYSFIPSLPSSSAGVGMFALILEMSNTCGRPFIIVGILHAFLSVIPRFATEIAGGAIAGAVVQAGEAATSAYHIYQTSPLSRFAKQSMTNALHSAGLIAGVSIISYARDAIGVSDSVIPKCNAVAHDRAAAGTRGKTLASLLGATGGRGSLIRHLHMTAEEKNTESKRQNAVRETLQELRRRSKEKSKSLDNWMETGRQGAFLLRLFARKTVSNSKSDAISPLVTRSTAELLTSLLKNADCVTEDASGKYFYVTVGKEIVVVKRSMKTHREHTVLDMGVLRDQITIGGARKEHLEFVAAFSLYGSLRERDGHHAQLAVKEISGSFYNSEIGSHDFSRANTLSHMAIFEIKARKQLLAQMQKHGQTVSRGKDDYLVYNGSVFLINKATGRLEQSDMPSGLDILNLTQDVQRQRHGEQALSDLVQNGVLAANIQTGAYIRGTGFDAKYAVLVDPSDKDKIIVTTGSIPEAARKHVLFEAEKHMAAGGLLFNDKTIRHVANNDLNHMDWAATDSKELAVTRKKLSDCLEVVKDPDAIENSLRKTLAKNYDIAFENHIFEMLKVGDSTFATAAQDFARFNGTAVTLVDGAWVVFQKSTEGWSVTNILSASLSDSEKEKLAPAVQDALRLSESAMGKHVSTLGIVPETTNSSASVELDGGERYNIKTDDNGMLSYVYQPPPLKQETRSGSPLADSDMRIERAVSDHFDKVLKACEQSNNRRLLDQYICEKPAEEMYNLLREFMVTGGRSSSGSSKWSGEELLTYSFDKFAADRTIRNEAQRKKQLFDSILAELSRTDGVNYFDKRELTSANVARLAQHISPYIKVDALVDKIQFNEIANSYVYRGVSAADKVFAAEEKLRHALFARDHFNENHPHVSGNSETEKQRIAIDNEISSARKNFNNARRDALKDKSRFGTNAFAVHGRKKKLEKFTEALAKKQTDGWQVGTAQLLRNHFDMRNIGYRDAINPGNSLSSQTRAVLERDVDKIEQYTTKSIGWAERQWDSALQRAQEQSTILPEDLQRLLTVHGSVFDQKIFEDFDAKCRKTDSDHQRRLLLSEIDTAFYASVNEKRKRLAEITTSLRSSAILDSESVANAIQTFSQEILDGATRLHRPGNVLKASSYKSITTDHVVETAVKLQSRRMDIEDIYCKERLASIKNCIQNSSDTKHIVLIGNADSPVASYLRSSGFDVVTTNDGSCKTIEKLVPQGQSTVVIWAKGSEPHSLSDVAGSKYVEFCYDLAGMAGSGLKDTTGEGSHCTPAPSGQYAIGQRGGHIHDIIVQSSSRPDIINSSTTEMPSGSWGANGKLEVVDNVNPSIVSSINSLNQPHIEQARRDYAFLGDLCASSPLTVEHVVESMRLGASYRSLTDVLQAGLEKQVDTATKERQQDILSRLTGHEALDFGYTKVVRNEVANDIKTYITVWDGYRLTIERNASYFTLRQMDKLAQPLSPEDANHEEWRSYFSSCAAKNALPGTMYVSAKDGEGFACSVWNQTYSYMNHNLEHIDKLETLSASAEGREANRIQGHLLNHYAVQEGNAIYTIAGDKFVHITTSEREHAPRLNTVAQFTGEAANNPACLRYFENLVDLADSNSLERTTSVRHVATVDGDDNQKLTLLEIDKTFYAVDRTNDSWKIAMLGQDKSGLVNEAYAGERLATEKGIGQIRGLTDGMFLASSDAEATKYANELRQKVKHLMLGAENRGAVKTFMRKTSLIQ